MTTLQALVLGVLQGLSEFIPISSSGHLVLLQKLFNISEGSMNFDIFLHLATLISLCIVMRKKLLAYLREPLGHVPKMVVLGTVPTVIIAFAFGKFFSELFETGVSLGFGFLYTAIILYLAEKQSGEAGNSIMPDGATGKQIARSGEAGMRIKPAGALVVGLAQGIAVTPAVSRSGSTIAAGLMTGASRADAIEFAFLMSIPVTLLAVAQDMLKMITGGELFSSAEAAVVGTRAAFGPVEMAVGFAAAAVTGYFSAKYMLKAIQKIKLTWFSAYVGILGALILLDQLFFGVVFDKFF